MKKRICGCGREMFRTRLSNRLTIEPFVVTDNNEEGWQCMCGESEVHASAMLAIEMRAAHAILMHHPNAGRNSYRFARKALGLTQEKLAASLDVAVETISRWESGSAEMPRTVQLALCGLISAGAALRVRIDPVPA